MIIKATRRKLLHLSWIAFVALGLTACASGISTAYEEPKPIDTPVADTQSTVALIQATIEDLTAVPATATTTPIEALSPTPEPSPTNTPEDPMSKIPEQLRTNIDHIDKLPDGRTVAIQKSENPDQPSLLRVLQLDSTGEWISYVPEISYTYDFPKNDSEYHGTEWLKGLSVPELKNKMVDMNGNEIPLGYMGSMVMGSDADTTYTDYWINGIIGGARENPEETSTEFAVFFPTPQGDWHVQTFNFLNAEVNNITNTYLAQQLDAKKLHQNNYKFSEFVRTTNAKYVLKKEPKVQSQFATYLLNHDTTGTQIAFQIRDHLKVGRKDYYTEAMNLIKIITGEESNIYANTQFYAFIPSWMIPESMEDILDN